MPVAVDDNNKETVFSNDEVDILVQMIKRTGITDREGFNTSQAAHLGQSIKMKLMNHARNQLRN